jgi:hypothetical protein
MTENCEKPAINLENKLNANLRDFELYKVSAIGLATFCGSVLAGGILLSQNFERLGKRDAATKTL